MTVTEETAEVQAGEEATEEGQEQETTEESKKRNRDFTKVRPYHEELTAYVNERSGLPPVTPNQVKAMLVLRTDYGNTDEAKAARQARKDQREADAKKYEGKTPEQIKAIKASNRAQAQADRFEAKAKEAIERAKKLKDAAEGSGEDLAALFSDQNASNGTETPSETTESEEAPRRRGGLGRRR